MASPNRLALLKQQVKVVDLTLDKAKRRNKHLEKRAISTTTYNTANPKRPWRIQYQQNTTKKSIPWKVAEVKSCNSISPVLSAPLMLMHQVHTVLMGQSWTTFRSTHLICPLLPIHRAHSQTQQRLTQSEPSITSLKTISQAIPKTLNKSINEIQIGIHHQHLNWLKKTLTALEKSIKAMHQKLVIKAIKSISQTSHPSN